jgi:hypothetical protein
MPGEGQRPPHRRGDVKKAVVRELAENTVAIATALANTCAGTGCK